MIIVTIFHSAAIHSYFECDSLILSVIHWPKKRKQKFEENMNLTDTIFFFLIYRYCDNTVNPNHVVKM